MFLRTTPARDVHLMGGRAAKAAIYPPDLCLQILRGLRDQLRHDESVDYAGQHDHNDMELNSVGDEINAVDNINKHTSFIDNVTSDIIPRHLALTAREEEIAFFHNRGVYRIVNRAESYKELANLLYQPDGFMSTRVTKGTQT